MTQSNLHPMVQLLVEQLHIAADPVKADQMQAYMKTQQPFYGVSAPVRKKQFAAIKKQFSLSGFDEYQEIIQQLWQGTRREEMYQAIEVAEKYKQFRTPQAMPLFEHMVKTASSWDTLDLIATKLVGELVLQHRELEPYLVKWRTDDSFWVRRASLLAHLKHKQATNYELLEQTILMLVHEKEFFIRKAIGWVLREIAKFNPERVCDFISMYESRLSNLSKREALKNRVKK